MTQLAPKLQDTLNEVVDVYDAMAPLRDKGSPTLGVLPFHVVFYRRHHSRCRNADLGMVAARLRRLAGLGLVVRVEGTRPVEWQPTTAGREQAMARLAQPTEGDR